MVNLIIHRSNVRFVGSGLLLVVCAIAAVTALTSTHTALAASSASSPQSAHLRWRNSSLSNGQPSKPQRQLRKSAAHTAGSPTKDECKLERDQLKVEEELRVALRTLRQAIDQYKVACESGMVGPLDRLVSDECYPPNFAALVNGVKPPNRTVRVRYLRRVPIDPTTGQANWGLRSMQDELEEMKWGGQNIFDVYSLSTGQARDGSNYKDW